MTDKSSVRDAATVILYRENADEHGEVFMVKRHGKSGFMAGAHVFPGGTLEEGDAPLAESLGAHIVDPHARAGIEAFTPALLVAALRETFEESAILLGSDAPLEARVALRTKLLKNELTFAQVLGQLAPDTGAFDALIPWSRWKTPLVEKRRFDARFFLIDLRTLDSAEAHLGQHDDVETTSAEWIGVDTALDAADKGDIWLAPPTSHTLLMLRDFGPSYEHPLTSICPQFFAFERPTLVLPNHKLHTDHWAAEGPVAFEMDETQRWVPLD